MNTEVKTELSAGRKIPLDANLYCIHTGNSKYGKEGCDHDYEPEPTRSEIHFAEWTCTRCGLVRSYEVWD